MKRTVLISALLLLGASLTASAGAISGKVSPGANSVVYVDTVAGKTFPAPTQHPVMDQRGLLFQPHVLVVQQGTTVEFLNSDNVAHNVFWSTISGNKKLGHNLGTWPMGEKRTFKFDNPGVVSLLCNVHPEMSGYLVVSPTPYYAQTDKTGNYRIENVPDGKYTLVAWHEGLKPQSKPVTVAAGDAKADFTLSK